LDPPQLGQVKIDVTFRDGILHARLVADFEQINVLLRDKALGLQRALRELGLDVDQVSVAVNSDSRELYQERRSNQDRPSRDMNDFSKENSDRGVVETGGHLDAVKHAPAAEDHWIA